MPLTQLLRIDTAHLLTQASIAITDKTVIELLLGIFTRSKGFLGIEALYFILPDRLSRYQARCPRLQQRHIQVQSLLVLLT
ncbi:hypothetical protein D3C76_1596490 [compost metagenome]